jgi:hypothetical protein
MKFTIERRGLVRLLELLRGRAQGTKTLDRLLCITAVAPRVFFEANGITAGVESVVLADGTCHVPRVKFLAILRTFANKDHLVMEAGVEGLRIGNFVMAVKSYSSEATPPSQFEQVAVTDTWLAPKPPSVPTVEMPTPLLGGSKPPKPEGDWLNRRWWE